MGSNTYTIESLTQALSLLATDVFEVQTGTPGSRANQYLEYTTLLSLLKALNDGYYNPLAVGGWKSEAHAWSYVSADGPIFYVDVNADVTGEISVGMRVKLTQTTVKYFIVHAVGNFAGGVTPITLYGGTDYTLANAVITLPCYSFEKVPFGFPMDPLKWSVIVLDTVDRSQASPVSGTWYNGGSLSISVPIGAWRLGYDVVVSCTSNAAQTLSSVWVALSTTNNGASDADLIGCAVNNGASGTLSAVGSVSRWKNVLVAVKTAYYLNIKTGVANQATIVEYNGSVDALRIVAVDSYL
jgi:hypothetical protein